MNKNSMSFPIDTTFKTVEPNIFGLFFRKSPEIKSYIQKCVDSYSGAFDSYERMFLRTFITDVYNIFSNCDKCTSNSPEEKIALFIETLCKYSIDTSSYINKHNDENFYIIEQLQYIDAGELMRDYLDREFMILKTKSIKDLAVFDNVSQRIILAIYGPFSASINQSLARLRRKKLEEIAASMASMDKELAPKTSDQITGSSREDAWNDFRIEAESGIENYINEKELEAVPSYLSKVLKKSADKKNRTYAVTEITGDEQNNYIKTKEDEFWEKIDGFLNNYTPKKLISYLDERVVSQEDAKTSCAVHLYNHVKRCKNPEVMKKKDVLLLIGPPGSGKTEIYRSLKEISPIPIKIIDSSAITSRGFYGAEFADIIENIVGSSHKSSESKIEKKYTLLVLDEFDKICRPRSNASNENVSWDIQSEFLVAFESGMLMGSSSNTLDVSSMGFVCLGAFEGIESNLKTRSIGFNSCDEIVSAADYEEALKKWGMMPELVSRISTIRSVCKLKEKDFVTILSTHSMSPISQLRAEFALDGIEFDVRPETIKAVAAMCHKYDCGARKMVAILRDASEKKYIEALEGDIPTKKIVITEKDILSRTLMI